jgi:hypothetical protein
VLHPRQRRVPSPRPSLYLHCATAKKAGLNRESLYKALGETGNAH